jgi:UDP-N-acetylglucosamine:LPS N-acetylglucosamine transferase
MSILPTLHRDFSARPGPGEPPQTTGPVLMVSTQGGHLAHLVALRVWWESRDRLWVCPDSPDVLDRLVGERVVRSYSPTTRNLPNLLRNSVLAVRLLLKERPSLLVSAGAGVAVPFFVAAWLLRIPTVFIEVYDRVDSPTMTVRLCGPFTTRRIVQWQQQLEFYPDARLVGPLL